jgi:hypothetical protein
MGISSFTSNQFHGESDPPESAIVKIPFRRISALESQSAVIVDQK